MDDVVVINGIEYFRRSPANAFPFVIVRCRNAGVHAGYLEDRSNGVVSLRDSRRLWRWWSAATLSELAIEGPLVSKISEQKYAIVLPVLTLTESDVCEVIPCSEAAMKAIQGVPAWRAAK